MKKRDNKQFVVIGLGSFGMSLAMQLGSMGYEVLAVDKRQELVNEVAPYVTEAVAADAADEAVLDSLGIRNFDVAVVSIGQNMRDSILVSVQCKELGVPFVMAKAMDDRHAKVLEKVGVDRVVFPEREMGQRMARALLRTNYIDMIDLDDEYQMIEINAPEAWCGRTLSEMNIRRNYGVSIIAIHRGKSFIVSPGADETIHIGDELLVLGRSDQIDNVDQK